MYQWKVWARLAALCLFSVATAANASPVFINELHYDNAGGDLGEGVEFAGPAGTDLAGWFLYYYNGNNGAYYHYQPLSGTITDQQNGFGTLALIRAGIQNGSPDGLALIDPSGLVAQFISYEGVLTASDGPAAGLTSVDIGVAESGATPVGHSLQLSGSGNAAGDFYWSSGPASFGSINAGQQFPAPVPGLQQAPSPNSGSLPLPGVLPLLLSGLLLPRYRR